MSPRYNCHRQSTRGERLSRITKRHAMYWRVAENKPVISANSEYARDGAHRVAQVAAAQQASAERLDADMRSRDNNVIAAQATLAQARADDGVLCSRLAYLTLLLPRAGTLLTGDYKTGDIMQPGRILMRSCQLRTKARDANCRQKLATDAT